MVQSNTPIRWDALKYVMSFLITGSLLVLLFLSCDDPVTTTASYIHYLRVFRYKQEGGISLCKISIITTKQS